MSTALDLATDAVVHELSQRGVATTRWNTEDFPFASRLTTAISSSQTSVHLTRPATGEVDFSDVTAVWYRRVRVPAPPDSLDRGVYDFCLRESRAALIGTLLAAIPKRARWMSDPRAVWTAEHKIVQLAFARECGLRIPDTVITNDPSHARRAFSEFGERMIAKPVRTGYVEVSGEPGAIFTSAVSSADMESMAEVDSSPVIFQPLIEKRCDVRVTVVGDQLFTAEIDSQNEPAAMVDWRHTNDPNLPHRKGALPATVEEQVRAFMKRADLAYGAFDFIATPDGDFVFLEVNPNGQWLWIDDKLQLGITQAITDWLAVVPGSDGE